MLIDAIADLAPIYGPFGAALATWFVIDAIS